MPRRVIDLPEKLFVFRKLMGVSATGFKDKLEDKKVNRRKAVDWEHPDENGQSIQLREQSRNQIRALLEDYDIVVDDDCFFERWEGLARRLGLTEEQIEAIRQEHQTPSAPPNRSRDLR